MKKLAIGLFLVILGISSVAIGFIGVYNQTANPVMTDERVIERARELGMVQLKEIITESQSQTESIIE